MRARILSLAGVLSLVLGLMAGLIIGGPAIAQDAARISVWRRSTWSVIPRTSRINQLVGGLYRMRCRPINQLFGEAISRDAETLLRPFAYRLDPAGEPWRTGGASMSGQRPQHL